MSGEDHGEKPPAATDLMGPEPRPIDPEVERRVLRKIDMFLMPAMVIGYGLVYYDKVSRPALSSSLSRRKTNTRTGYSRERRALRHDVGPRARRGGPGNRQDRHVAAELGDVHLLLWAAGRLVPHDVHAAALQHALHPRPGVMVWAVICAATAGVSTWQGLLAQRFFLGALPS
ncbi:hypothetical protein NUW58_g10688 [Xylaria curta]|uniref:Uncharacterized protein n=1 Tax=Xylaria curta TaxID=42375 RepID=A0ACC1MJ03_9PEZI|nr:hypothetical protein NUW58_g10688 [Xylaria curta]